MIHDALTLVSAAALFWAATALPARWLTGGAWTLVYSGVAMLVCLAFGVLTLVGVEYARRRDPAGAPILILAATGVRMFGVLAAGLLLVFAVPFFSAERGFLVWLLVFYLFTLALEMALLLRNRSRPGSPA